MMRPLRAAAVAAALVTFGSPASAQPEAPAPTVEASPAAPPATAPGDAPPAADDPAAIAREQFRDGLARMAAEDWAGALALFKQVARYRTTAQVAFNLAECEEHLGLLVSALGHYRLALGKAQDGSAPKVAEVAPTRIAALEPRIGRVVVARTEPTPNPRAEIELDGVLLSPAQIDREIPVDPGKRLVRVMIDGGVVSSQTVEVAEGARVAIDVPIPAPREAGTDGPGGAQGPSVPGIVLVASGGALLVLGGVFLGLRQGAIGELEDLCGGDTTCPGSAESVADRGRTFTGLAEVTIPAGAVAAAVGIVLLVTHGNEAAPAEAEAGDEAARWVPHAPGADVAGASFVTRF